MVRTPGWRRAGKLGQRPRIVKARSAAGSQELVAEQTHQRAERPEPQQCDQPRPPPPPESAPLATFALADPFAPTIRRILAVAMMGPEVGTKRRPRFRGFHRVSPQPRQARDRCNPRISDPRIPVPHEKAPAGVRPGLGIESPPGRASLRVVHLRCRRHFLELRQRTEPLRLGLPGAAAGRGDDGEDGQENNGEGAEHGWIGSRFWRFRVKHDDAETLDRFPERGPLQVES